MSKIKQTRLVTSDGVELSLLEAGSGSPLMMLPGWSQTAAMFRHQFEGLSDRYRVIALDWRGHGHSQKVAHGYRLSRFAMDLHEVIEALDLESVAVLGHSMGNGVLWCHWDLFGRDRFSKMIIAEQPPTLLARSAWSPKERTWAGCIVEASQLVTSCDKLEGPDATTFARDFVAGMLSDQISEEDRRFIVEENLQLPRHAAASLLQDTTTADWRDLIPRIDIPTLICAGKASVVPYASQEWIQQQIPGAKLIAFEADEGGSHFMFWEAFEKFNRVVAEFLG